jgi:hypothetical protein
MNKILFCIALLGLFLVACNDSYDATEPIDISEKSLRADSDFQLKLPKKQRTCDAERIHEEKIKNNPGYAKKTEQIEKHTQKLIAAKGKPSNPGGGGGGGGGGTLPTGVINIPVYVHVIYNNANENISQSQIQSQIDVLNADFSANNGDLGLVPSEFSSLVADSEFSFTLAGVTRTSSSRTSWGTNDQMKFTSNGGHDVVTPETHLNIWVCNIGGGILGYAQFPGGSSSTDGVVISPPYFGTTGYVSSPFDGGRTATHEVGHYLNLRHIWGDGRCNRDDFVADTPTSDAPNYGCPGYPTVNCRSTDMTMNYMDYTDDACMQMFSLGQKDRMRALFAAGGARESML